MRHPRAGVLKPCQLVVCGVAASGKSTLAAALAEALSWPFLEGDELHPPANVAKMAAGVPLDDSDRAPWLARIAGRLGDWSARGCSGIVTCSALKRAYRHQLASAAPDAIFVFVEICPVLAAERLGRRQGHFMPPALIDSQFAALEPPGTDERVVIVPAAATVADQVATVAAYLSAR